MPVISTSTICKTGVCSHQDRSKLLKWWFNTKNWCFDHPNWSKHHLVFWNSTFSIRNGVSSHQLFTVYNKRSILHTALCMLLHVSSNHHGVRVSAVTGTPNLSPVGTGFDSCGSFPAPQANQAFHPCRSIKWYQLCLWFACRCWLSCVRFKLMYFNFKGRKPLITTLLKDNNLH